MSQSIALRPRETIAFLGDSITEQNLYTAFIETYLRTRLPGHELSFYNFGWGGDTAPGGAKRYARDVLPVKPDVVLVKFGMNDGGYTGPDAAIRERYLAGQAALADAIAAGGARQVLITPNAVDPHKGLSHLQHYNPSLALFAEHLQALAHKRGILFIDLFAPFLAVQTAAKTADPSFTMIPDGVHPLEVGHLVMAYIALRHFDLPQQLGTIVVGNDSVRCDGAAGIGQTAAARGSVSFDLSLPYLPYFVPEAARKALALVPFQDELNHFRLDCTQWRGDRSLVVSIDGQEFATIRPSDRSKPIDLALLGAAPWAQRGKMLWDLCQNRFRAHYLAWREIGVSATPGVQGLPNREALAAPLKALVTAMGSQLAQLTAAMTVRVTITESAALPIDQVAVSPLYPFVPGDKTSFAAGHPPETSAESVSWRLAHVVDHQLNLGVLLGDANGAPTNCVSYVRFVLDAAAAARVRLLLGSDDGITVLHNSVKVFAHDINRGCKLGDDQVDIMLAPGRNVILLRVTQGGGGYAVAVRADLLDDTVAVKVSAD